MSKEYLLYEKIADISEEKQNIIEENNKLKKDLESYNERLFENFCQFVDELVDSLDFSKELDEGMFSSSKNEEEKMAKYFIKVIKDRARKNDLDPKKVAEYIVKRLRGF